MARKKKYTVTDPTTGEKVSFRGDRDPTEEEVAAILQRNLELSKDKVKSPIKAAVLAASNQIGGPFSTQYWVARAKGLPHPEAMQKAEEISAPLERKRPSGIPAQLAAGAVQAAPLLAGAASPFVAGAAPLAKLPLVGKIAQGAVGLGAFETAKGAVTGQISTPEQAGETFKEGAKAGATFAVGGKLGATAAQPLRALTRQATRLGSAAGGAAAGAALAPKGEKVAAGLLGGAFGARHPAQPIGGKTSTALRKKATQIYREVLRPSQPETRKLSKQGKNIDKFYELAAKENLSINATADKKLDTAEARKGVQDKVSVLSEKLNKILGKDTVQRFNLNELRKSAKAGAKSKIKNALELEKAETQIDAEIDAEIGRKGRALITASELNQVKQGMWSKSFNILEPNSKVTSRKIGTIAKNMIEKAFPQENIKGINAEQGDLLTLHTLLTGAEGRVIQGGRLGELFARSTGAGVGAIAGSTLGTSIPLVGPLLGGAIGQQAGSVISKAVTSPKGRIKKAQKLFKKAAKQEKPGLIDKLLERKTGTAEKPEILSDIKPGAKVEVSNQKFIEAKRRLALPAPKSKPIHSRTQDPNAIRLTNKSTGEVIIVPSEKGRLIESLGKTLQKAGVNIKGKKK